MKKLLKVLSLMVAVLFTAVILFSCGTREDKKLKFKEFVVENNTYTIGSQINRTKKLDLSAENKIRQAVSKQIDIVVSPEISQFVSAEHGFALHIVLDNPNGSSITRISINGTYYYGSSLIQAPQVIGETLNDLFVNVSGEAAGIKDYELTDIRYTVYGTDTETSFGSTQWGNAERVLKVGVTISDWEFSVRSSIVRDYTSITVNLNNLKYPAFAVENEYTLLAVLLNASNSTVLVSTELYLNEGHWTLTYDNLIPNGNYNLAVSLACDLQLTTDSNVLVTPMSMSGFSVTPKLITESDITAVTTPDYNSVDVELNTHIRGWHVEQPNVTIDFLLNVNTYYQRSLLIVVVNDENEYVRVTISKIITFTTLAHELEDLSIVQLAGRSFCNQTPMRVTFTNVDGYIVKDLIAVDENGVELKLKVNSSTGFNSINYNFDFDTGYNGASKTLNIIGYSHPVVNGVGFDSITTTVYLEDPLILEVCMNTLGHSNSYPYAVYIVDILLFGEHEYSGYVEGESLTYTFVFNQDISGLSIEFMEFVIISLPSYSKINLYDIQIEGNLLIFKTDEILLLGVHYPRAIYFYLNDIYHLSGVDAMLVYLHPELTVEYTGEVIFPLVN